MILYNAEYLFIADSVPHSQTVVTFRKVFKFQLQFRSTFYVLIVIFISRISEFAPLNKSYLKDYIIIITGKMFQLDLQLLASGIQD
jgi:hypothetical protein